MAAQSSLPTVEIWFAGRRNPLLPVILSYIYIHIFIYSYGTLTILWWYLLSIFIYIWQYIMMMGMLIISDTKVSSCHLYLATPQWSCMGYVLWPGRENYTTQITSLDRKKKYNLKNSVWVEVIPWHSHHWRLQQYGISLL